MFPWANTSLPHANVPAWTLPPESLLGRNLVSVGTQCLLTIGSSVFAQSIGISHTSSRWTCACHTPGRRSIRKCCTCAKIRTCVNMVNPCSASYVSSQRDTARICYWTQRAAAAPGSRCYRSMSPDRRAHSSKGVIFFVGGGLRCGLVWQFQ